MCLNRIMERMTREALTASLKHRSPSLFEKTVGDTLTPVEKNGEVNRFLGWAIFSAQKKFEDDQPEHKILNAMHCKLDDLDSHYIETYYDRHMSMLNTGGMTLVSGEFFEWGRKVMDVARERISQDLFERDPKKGLAREKTAILKDKSLRNVFSETCKRNSADCQSAIDTVCNTILQKIVHAKYADQFSRFKETAVKMKDKIAQRNHLKVAEAHLNGPSKNQKDESRRAQCKKDASALSKKRNSGCLPKPTPAEAKLARKKRREIMNKSRLRKQLFVDK